MVISSASSGQHAFLLSDCDNVFRMSPRGIEYALCTICDENISLARTGIKALTKHCKSDRHIRLKGSRESAGGKSYASVYESECPDDAAIKQQREFATQLAEGAFVYYSIAHGHSFKSLECIAQIVRALYDPNYKCSNDKG